MKAYLMSTVDYKDWANPVRKKVKAYTEKDKALADANSIMSIYEKIDTWNLDKAGTITVVSTYDEDGDPIFEVWIEEWELE